MQTAMFYLLAIGLLILSYSKDKMKTKKSVMKAVKYIENMMPQVLRIRIGVGVTLVDIDAQTLSRVIGRGSAWLGVALAGILEGITLIPGFLAVATAAL